MMVWIVGSLLLYVITIFIRRHNGGHAPHVNDAEARRLKYVLSVHYVKEMKQYTQHRNSCVRKATRLKDDGYVCRNSAVIRGELMKKLFGLYYQTDDVNNLISENQKLRFHYVINTRRNFWSTKEHHQIDVSMYSKSSIEVERKEALLVNYAYSVIKCGKCSESESSEYSFPLTLFNDMSEKIETQKAGAEDFGETE